MSKEKIIKILTKNNVKPTLHRIGVMEVLTTLHTHPTADEIFKNVKINYPTISLATVYNTLDILYRNDIIKTMKHNNEPTRYDFFHEPHFHLFDNETFEIYDFKDDELRDLISNHLKDKKIDNHSIKDFDLEIKVSTGNDFFYEETFKLKK
ncbi:MAG: hypothetical protein A2X64_04550 [Ignavibacteria bacterium GWF2_33_9]|nr:MAG: hypothetical protein A2X64_04550 [Ignavibacteria bacterium GWF2_33_9]